MNELNTILDQSGARAEVQKWLIDSWLERQEYDSGLADTKYADTLMLPEGKGQYLEKSRKGQPRRPQKLDHANPLSDPASGMLLSEEKLVVPIEYIQEYTGIGEVARITSRHDLEEWAKEDLPEGATRRFHELTQNCMKVGRYLPGIYDTDGTASTAFDTTIESSVTMWGVAFTFLEAHHSFVNNVPNHNALLSGHTFTVTDFEKEAARLRLKGAKTINGKYVAYISDSIHQDLMLDKRYARAFHSQNAANLPETFLVDYAGFHFMRDDFPFTENFNAANVRVTNGPIHTAFCFGKSAFAYVKHGSNPRVPRNPTFKIQDISITGVYKTIGTLIPFQAAVTNANWCGTIAGPVRFYDPDNM